MTLALCDEEGRNFATIVNPGVSGETYQVSEDSLVTKQSYDTKGNVAKETDAMGTATAYSYDDSDRVTEVTQNAGKDGAVVTKASYEADTENQKNKTTITDAGGRKSIEVTDAAGLIKSNQDQGEKEDESIATAYSYDSRGNQTKVTYENGDYREDTYDARNLKTVSKYYQADGIQTLQTNYQYDDQYRLTKMTDAKKSGSERKAYRYTYTGYDGFGRTAWTAEVSQEAEPSDAQIAKHKISYSYDTEDKITEVTYALAEDGRVESLHYAYDKNQYLIAIKAKIKGSDGEKLIRKYRYNERGKLFTIVDFTDYRDKNESYVARFYEYDALDRVSSMTYKSGTTVLEAYTYSYDKNSNIVKKTEKNSTAKEEKDYTDQTTEYTYNALGRLTKSVVTDHKKNEEKTTTTYSYNSAGNRTKKVKGEEETAYTYNGLNQLLKAKTTKGDTVKNDISYEYDVNGNQIKETDKETGDSVENTYDVENRLSTVTVTKKSGTSGNETVSLTQENLYNGDGQRIQKKEAGEVTNYFYEDGMVSYTTGADTGEKLIQNLSGLEDNVIYAEQKVTGTDGTASDYQDFLYTKDIQGSTSSILNKDTKGELSYEYDDFGETSIHGNSALKNEICYTGGIYDESTGLYYLNARYYDPENGRFLTEDTYRGEVNDPDTLHLYAYCANDPINYVDPSGHMTISIAAGMKAIFATVSAAGLWPVAAVCVGILIAMYAHNKPKIVAKVTGKIISALLAVACVAVKTREFVKKIAKTVAKARVATKRGKDEKHHIVAQGAKIHHKLKKRMEDLGISIHSKANTVYLDYRLHRRLHTNIYYIYVRDYVGKDTVTKPNILYRLSRVKRILLKANQLVKMV